MSYIFVPIGTDLFLWKPQKAMWFPHTTKREFTLFREISEPRDIAFYIYGYRVFFNENTNFIFAISNENIEKRCLVEQIPW